MRLISFFSLGVFFGIVMTKSEAISWFRIHEMFRFEGFHMYGIIGVAVMASAIIIWTMKKLRIRTSTGQNVSISGLKLNAKRHLLAGSIFGLGWALIGACPGPIFVLIGQGFWIFLLVLASAVAGTYTYALVRRFLPH